MSFKVMFNACRRGHTSITRALYNARASFRFSAGSSNLYPYTQINLKPFETVKWIHHSRNLRDEDYSSIQNQSQEHRKVQRFQELEDFEMVHSNIIKQITQKMNLDTMTEVQVATINEALQGVDIIAQARTGTGKTLGFLIPTIQNIIKHSPELATRQRYSRARPSDIRAIIISPTRELAEQIAVEADKLCYNTDLVVQVAVGGNSKRQMLMKTQREGCHLLVATPGRLTDLLTDEYSGVRAPNLTTLVLDEADRLLDEGFSKDIERIINILPNRDVQDRQTLLFSATVPREVMSLVRKTLKPNFHFVQTVKEGELATHEKVPQNIIVTPGIENWMPTLVQIAKKYITAESQLAVSLDGVEHKPFKAIVYFSSTAQVQLAYEVITRLRTDEKNLGSRYNNHPLKPAELYIINGSMTQEGRTRAANKFRACRSGMLFSTDVTARGMDFPGVSHVIQCGLPPNKEQYIHRVGRTGRGDKTGEAYIIIDKASVSDARKMLRGLPVTKNESFEAAKFDMSQDGGGLSPEVAEIMAEVAASTSRCTLRSKEAAYKSALNNIKTPDQAASLARWTKYGWGLDQPPPISSILASKLGLKRMPGINIGPPTQFEDEPVTSRGYSGSFGGRERNESFGRGSERGSFSSRERNESFGRGSERGSFGKTGGRGGYSNFRDRGGFNSRDDRGSFGGRGGRSNFDGHEDRGGYSNKGRSSGYEKRGGSGNFSSRGGRKGFGNR
ncbi:ATP-dependent RNA helicase, mitochondrial [Erysiphe necator]|uniref:ATP-dependent RNA helicase n=1 Tax=Uncinula necator TaxID=52586 RepID=A0A0B1PCX3_UNCNE|nr:ATP-dependent RNA helicase, mitochondrial [Erysiphe necator]KHJ34514.1 putative atp-dependent rna helicase [Erysiphe necator]